MDTCHSILFDNLVIKFIHSIVSWSCSSERSHMTPDSFPYLEALKGCWLDCTTTLLTCKSLMLMTQPNPDNHLGDTMNITYMLKFFNVHKHSWCFKSICNIAKIKSLSSAFAWKSWLSWAILTRWLWSSLFISPCKSSREFFISPIQCEKTI